MLVLFKLQILLDANYKTIAFAKIRISNIFLHVVILQVFLLTVSYD